MRALAPALLGLCLLLAGCAGPQPAYLWKVEKPGAPPSYLLGTVHRGVAVDELADRVHQAWAESEQVVFEVDPSAIDPQLGLLPEGESLKELLPFDAWKRLQAQLPPAPGPRLEQLQPLSVSNRLYALRAAPPSMDFDLWRRARDAGKQLRYLERPEVVLLHVTRPETREAQVTALVNQLNDPEAHARQQAVVQDAYRDGKLELFLTVPALDGLEESMLLYTRNEAWLREGVLDRALEEGRAFVAVGLAHLVKERGLIVALRERGYTVTRADGVAREH